MLSLVCKTFLLFFFFCYNFIDIYNEDINVVIISFIFFYAHFSEYLYNIILSCLRGGIGQVKILISEFYFATFGLECFWDSHLLCVSNIWVVSWRGNWTYDLTFSIFTASPLTDAMVQIRMTALGRVCTFRPSNALRSAV